jgi:hypothetical protein
MPEGTVKWFDAERATGDLGAPETARTDFALASAIPDALGESLNGVGLVGAVVALGIGVALSTALLRRETGRAGRWWRWVVVAGAVAAVAASAGDPIGWGDLTTVAGAGDWAAGSGGYGGDATA